MKLVVKISPFYGGRGWFDPKSGLNFIKGQKDVIVPEGKDIFNIKRDIIHNALLIVEGSIEEYEQDIIDKKVELQKIQDTKLAEKDTNIEETTAVKIAEESPVNEVAKTEDKIVIEEPIKVKPVRKRAASTKTKAAKKVE